METSTTHLQREKAPVPGTNCILLVDDEPHVLAVGKAVLSSQGFEVACSPSGNLAIDLVRHAQENGAAYACIVLDLTMPGGPSGFDVLGMIQEIDSDMPIIACSGYFQEDARDLCRAIGFYDVLAKPYNLESLCTVVRRAIARVQEVPPPSGLADKASGAFENSSFSSI